MYTEEYDKRPFPFRDFLLKFIIIVIFALFLIWLIPKFISPKTSKQENSSSKVFQKNLTAMKKASINYYSKKANLPTDNNKEVITLRQMISKKMLTPFTDKNGKACDVTKSYSEITSDNGEYILKVKLKCSNEEDYVLTKLGSYSYCTTEVCEKDLSKTDTTNNNTVPDTTKSDSSDTSDDEVETPDTSKTEDTTDNTNDTSNSSDTNSSTVNYIYEYQKTTAGVFSKWTPWSGKAKNSNRYKEITCGATDSNCLKEIKISTRREVIGKTALGQNVVATVSYYQTRTRTYTPGITDTKWSSENDQSLLKAGYKMTGNKKEAN